ncbi:ThuA domain-containing protein [Altererythrobacter lutimaris]|uniref:ThuA domain-containing protein n=1 Tax=Altererythrobacter lutimaris TaxID=2743979 RepID=A0A850H3B0_9SPHN|nr:ThuA domain-containing protein [Altererythrobacter lutimaris]NVE93637.1 ThuA domain-containing protein [Altererythrobacter lutimaris]
MFKPAFLIAAVTGLCAPLLNLATSAPIDPPVTYDTERPEITQWMRHPAILVFSKTRGWRHNEGIAGADLFFVELAEASNMGVFTTVNGAVFNHEQLSRFEVVVFNNMTGDTLSPEQEKVFQSWLEDGGSLIALHGSGAASHTDWPWYDDRVIGPEFIGHPQDPQFQEARVVNLTPDHPILAGLPADWIKEDEWYSFNRLELLAGATPLLGLDESTYIPELRRESGTVDLRMGEEPQDHPVAWVRCIGNGRTIYSALGHHPRSYQNEHYRKFLINAFEWVRRRGEDATEC